MPSDIGALYRVHAARVWRYARARLPSDADAEDVTSDVFLRAMRSHHTFDPARGTESAWIVGIARNAVAEWWRSRKPEDPTDNPGDGRVGADRSDPGPIERAIGADEARELVAHLGALTDREREAIALRFGADLSSPEIGTVMGISPTAARMLVHRGITRLREVMSHE